jgi:hypothetical protein
MGANPSMDGKVSLRDGCTAHSSITPVSFLGVCIDVSMNAWRTRLMICSTLVDILSAASRVVMRDIGHRRGHGASCDVLAPRLMISSVMSRSKTLLPAELVRCSLN